MSDPQVIGQKDMETYPWLSEADKPQNCVAISKLPHFIRGLKYLTYSLSVIDAPEKVEPQSFYSWSGVQQKWLPAVASRRVLLLAYAPDDCHLQFTGLADYPCGIEDVGKEIYLSRKILGKTVFYPTSSYIGLVVAPNRILLNTLKGRV